MALHFFLYFTAEANEKEQRDRAQGVQSTRRAEAQDISSGNFSYIFWHGHWNPTNVSFSCDWSPRKFLPVNEFEYRSKENMQIEGKYADRMIKRDVFNMKKEKTQNISCWNLHCFNISNVLMFLNAYLNIMISNMFFNYAKVRQTRDRLGIFRWILKLLFKKKKRIKNVTHRVLPLLFSVIKESEKKKVSFRYLIVKINFSGIRNKTERKKERRMKVGISFNRTFDHR